MSEYEKTLQKIRAFIEKKPEFEAYQDYFNAMRLFGKESKQKPFQNNLWLRKETSRWVNRLIENNGDISNIERFYELNKKTYLYVAQDDFHSYCTYIEWNRPVDRRFYQPRARALKEVVDGLQALADGKLNLLAISMPPGVGKTGLAIFYLCWLAGKRPDLPMLCCSHSNSFLQGVYEECLRIMQPNGEYLWCDVFSGSQVVKTNAKDMKIDVNQAQRFSTFQFSSIGSGNAGKVRAQSLLYGDDLCSGIEEALSKERMDSLWYKYTVDMRQRKEPSRIGECPELHIATRWSVHDVIGRLEREYAGSDRAKFIAVPALNEKGESNFDYGNGKGFTTQSFKDIQRTMDDASWRALYMNEPIEREGQLYHPSEIRRYFELPKGEPDSIIAVCDPKERGTDYAFMPIAYVYGQDYYIEDCICNKNWVESLDIVMGEKLLKHNVKACRYESNSAGWRTAEKIHDYVKRHGGITHITSKRSVTNKETRIIVNSSWVKEHCLFKDETQYRHGSEYWTMMNFLFSYTMAGKNKNDDVPDGMAMLADFAQSVGGAKIEILPRLW